MGIPRTTDGDFSKASEAPYSSDGMVTFAQAIRVKGSWMYLLKIFMN